MDRFDTEFRRAGTLLSTKGEDNAGSVMKE